MEKAHFIKKIENFIISHGFPASGATIIATVSGGADSVALLHILLGLGYNVIAAHCNFHLRGEESNRDEAFVAELCRRLQVPLEIKHFDVPQYAAENRLSIEMACRSLRYAWFETLRQNRDAAAIAVGHHSDDNVETFFLNLMRGSGCKGLAAIRPVLGNLIRPLLCVSRAEIEEYLESLGETHITDSTNAQNDFTRNKLRNIAIPALEATFPGITNAIARTTDILRDEDTFMQEAIRRYSAEIITESRDGWHIDSARLLAIPGNRTLLFRILNAYGFNPTQCGEILASLTAGTQVGSQWHSTHFTASISRTSIDIFPHNTTASDIEEHRFTLFDDLSQLPMPLKVEMFKPDENFRFARDNRTAYFSTDILSHTLVMCHRRTGDRISPFGMHGSRLVSDIFSDLHLNAREKESTWLIECDGKILWIPGIRASRHFACAPGAAIVALSLIPY